MNAIQAVLVLWLVISIQAHAKTPDYIPVADSSAAQGVILLDRNSVQFLHIKEDQEPLLLMRWARMYNKAMALIPEKPLVKHHLFQTTGSCSGENAAITMEEMRTEAFDQVALIKSEKWPMSDDIRAVRIFPGYKEALDYVCAHREQWPVMLPSK